MKTQSKLFVVLLCALALLSACGKSSTSAEVTIFLDPGVTQQQMDDLKTDLAAASDVQSWKYVGSTSTPASFVIVPKPGAKTEDFARYKGRPGVSSVTYTNGTVQVND